MNNVCIFPHDEVTHDITVRNCALTMASEPGGGRQWAAIAAPTFLTDEKKSFCQHVKHLYLTYSASYFDIILGKVY